MPVDGFGEQWHVTLGDGVVVTAGDRDATPRARKARALIACLATAGDSAASRATLVALLWSNRGRDQARASLRQCLFELRRDVPGLIGAEGETLSLAATVTTVPVRPGAVVLADLDALDPALDRWLAARRRDWPEADGASSANPAPTRRWLRPGKAAGAALTLVLGAWLTLHRAAPHPPLVILMPLAGPADPVSRAAAARFTESARTMLAATRIRLLPGTEPSGADWIADGTVAADGAAARITTSRGDLLWSAHEAAARDGIVAAADRLAHRTARTLACAAGGPPVRRTAAATAILMDFCDTMQSDVGGNDFETVIALARRLVAASPRDAYAHGHLAASLAFAAPDEPPPLAAPAREEAEREAATALALDARTGEAWLARVMLARDRGNVAGTEAAIRRGLAAEPDHPHLPNYLAGLLTQVGRLNEALIEAQRGLALDPASPAKRAGVADLLLRTGSPRAAFAMLDDPGMYDPSHVLARERVDLLAWSGDTAAMRPAIAAAGEAIETAGAATLIARTRGIGDPQGPAGAALLARAAATRDDPARADYRVLVLASLGQTNAALNEALRAPVRTEAFFRPNTRALLLSPRFPAVARRQGLWAYWQTTGRWPDICADPALGWRCGVNTPSAPH